MVNENNEKDPTTIIIPSSVNIKGRNYTVTGFELNGSTVCSSVTTIKIPKTLKKFVTGRFYSQYEKNPEGKLFGNISFGENKAFYTILPNLKYFYVDSNNAYFAEIRNQLLVSKDKSTLICCPPAATDPTAVIFTGIKKFGAYAFNGCKLNKLIIPASLEEIDPNAFSNFLGLSEFANVASGTANERFRAIDGVLYEMAKGDDGKYTIMKTLLRFPIEKYTGSKMEYNVDGKGQLSSIGQFAFEDVSIVQIFSISNADNFGLTIDKYAFYNSGIKMFSANSFYNSIGSFAFAKSQLVSLKMGTYSFTGTKVCHIYPHAFANSQVQQINLPTNSTAQYMTINIHDYAFADCPNLRNVSVPKYNATPGAGLAPIGKYAFANCPSLEQIDFSYCLPGKGTYGILPEGLFYQCTNLKSIKFEDNVVTEIGPMAFMACDLQEWPFANQTNSLTTIENAAFSGRFVNGNNVMSANNLGNVNLNEFKVLKTIGACAFYHAGITNDLLSFYTNDKGTSVIERIEPYTFSGNKFKKIIFAEGIKNIEHDAFTSCSQLTLVHLPNSLENIEWALNLIPNSYCDDLLKNYGVNDTYLPYCLNLSRIEIYNNETYGTTLHGLLYNKKTMELIHCPESYTVTSKSGYQYLNVKGLIIEDEVTGIKSLAPYCFFYSTLQKIVLPSTLESIGIAAFHGSDLRSITIPSSVKKIGYAMFGGGGRAVYNTNFSFDLFMMPVTAPSMNEYIQNGKPLTTLGLGLENINIYVKKTAYENGNYDEWKGKYNNLTYKIPIPSTVTQKKRCFSVCRDFDIDYSSTNLVAYSVYGYGSKENYITARGLGTYIPSRIGANHDKYVGAIMQLSTVEGDANYKEDGNWYKIGEKDYASGKQVTRSEEKYLGPNFENNWLVGCPIPTYVGVKNGTTPFYALKYNEDKKVSRWAQYSASGVVPMNKAYLDLTGHEYPSSTQAKELGIIFDDEEENTATDIDEAIVDVNEAEGNQKAVYYNLNGVKVENPTKGIYVRNGKKVVIK